MLLLFGVFWFLIEYGPADPTRVGPALSLLTLFSIDISTSIGTNHRMHTADLKAFRQKQELVRRNSDVEGVSVVASASASAESERATSAASNAASSAASGVSQTYRSGLLKQKEELLRSLAEVERLLSE